jgi:hypothetical protein
VTGAFKRDEPLHERLAREGGMEAEAPAPPPPPGPLIPEPAFRLPEWVEVSSLLKQRSADWDAVVIAEAPGLEGGEVQFVALADGSLIVEVEGGGASLDPLADAVEQKLERPYRAVGARRERGFWAVAARRIDVVELAGLEEDELELAVYEGELTASVDRDLSPLEELAAGRGLSDYAVQAERLDGDLWEARVTPL